MGEPDRDSRRRNDQALDEIRRLFERYRTIARREAAADRHEAATRRFTRDAATRQRAVARDEDLITAGR